VEAVRNRLGEEENLVQGGAARSKASLGWGENRVFFKVEGKAGKDKALEELRNTRSEGDRTVGGGRVGGFFGLKDRNDGAGFPTGRKSLSRPRKIEKMKE
jgi:hypothetical protein